MLNWWFDFSGQLEALNLDTVARKGLTSTNRRHACGPVTVRDLHGVCKSAVKHNEALMRMARSSFASTSSGAAFLTHLYNTYVAPHRTATRVGGGDGQPLTGPPWCTCL